MFVFNFFNISMINVVYPRYLFDIYFFCCNFFFSFRNFQPEFDGPNATTNYDLLLIDTNAKEI